MLAYAVRHAQSLQNVKQTEDRNAGLSELGRQQAEALRRRFANVSISAIYSSPFRRCIETAEPLARELGLPVRIRPELCEFHGILPGAFIDTNLPPIDEIATAHSAVLACMDHAGPMTWPSVYETLADVVLRMQAFARFLKGRWTGNEDCVLVISHGSPIARLAEAWLTDQPGPAFRFVIDNATVNAFRYHEGVSSLVCLNEASHLRGIPVAESSNFRADGSIKPIPATAAW